MPGLNPGELRSGGQVLDADGRRVLQVMAGGAALESGQVRQGNRVLDEYGREVVTAEIANWVTRSLKSYPGLTVVGGESYIPDALNVAGTNVAQHVRRRVMLTGDLQLISLVFGGWYMTPSTTPLTELVLPNDLTVRAAVETVGGRTTPLRFKGATQFVVPAGGTIATDPIDVDIPLTDDFFYLRLYVEVATTAAQWGQQGFVSVANGEGLVHSATVPADQTTGTGVLTGTVVDAARAFAPHAILGTTSNQDETPMVALAGDSILAGQNSPTITPKQFYGYAHMALEAADIPYLRLAKPSERAMDIAGSFARYARRLSLGGGCSHVLVQYGINDFRIASRTAAQVANDNLSLARKWVARGSEVLFQTLTPSSGAADGSTVETAPNTQRVLYNDWVRDGCPVDPSTGVYVVTGTANALRTGSTGHPVTDYFEVADTVETSRNAGTWRPGMTGDGVHPNGAGHVAMAASIVTSKFR